MDEFDKKVEPYIELYHKEEEIVFMEQNAPSRGDSVFEIPDHSMNSPNKTQENIMNHCISDLNNNHIPSVVQKETNECPKCKIPLVLINHLASLVCLKCGYMQNHLDVTSLCPFSRDVDNSFHYKRINHYNEFLILFQGKENTKIPFEIIESVMENLYAQGLRNISQVNLIEVRHSLRKLSLRKFYENEAQIHFIITGIRPPQMNSTQEKKMRMRFFAIQGPFKKHRPPNRKNFFSYHYIGYKICEIEKWYQYLPRFRLHKGSDKRIFLDQIWKKICKELDGKDPLMPWPFYKTPLPDGMVADNDTDEEDNDVEDPVVNALADAVECSLTDENKDIIMCSLDNDKEEEDENMSYVEIENFKILENNVDGHVY